MPCNWVRNVSITAYFEILNYNEEKFPKQANPIDIKVHCWLKDKATILIMYVREKPYKLIIIFI